MVYLMVLLTIILSVSVDSIIQYRKKRREVGALKMPGIFSGIFNENSVLIPRDFFG